MNEFYQKLFIDIGKTLYVELAKNYGAMSNITEEERREVYKYYAEISFKAADEFVKVFHLKPQTNLLDGSG